MVSFGDLYDRKYKTPISRWCWWYETASSKNFLAIRIESRINSTTFQYNIESSRKDHAILKRHSEINARDHVFLKFLPRRMLWDSTRVTNRGLFFILEKIGSVAYKLALPPTLPNMHKKVLFILKNYGNSWLKLILINYNVVGIILNNCKVIGIIFDNSFILELF